MRSLPVLLRVEGRPVILIGDVADAKRRLLERAGARVVGEDDPVAWVAIVAHDDAEEARAAAARLRPRALVNVVDRPELCDFTLPAIVDRNPVLIAIGSGGASAGLTAALRQRLEALLPADLGALANALHAARGAIRKRWPDAAARRRALAGALGPGAPLDPLRTGRSSIADWLAGGETEPAGRLVAIRLRSPDPDDMSLREARLLASADRIFHAADVPAAVLARARADAVRTCAPPPRRLPAGEPIGLSIDLAFA